MQKEKITLELIAPCGMNCGICIAFFGYTISGKKRKHPCSGCRSRDRGRNINGPKSLNRNKCSFIKKHCEKLATKQIEYCFECTDFSCEKLKTLDKRYRDRYGMSMIENLMYIQKEGVNQFLKNEQERWKCPTCGGVICVHNKKCYTCN